MVVEQQLAPPATTAPGRRFERIAVRALLAVGALVTVLGLLLVVSAWTEDVRIDRATGYANAEVVSVSFQRTLVRYQTPDGAEHIPSVGVLYPHGLAVGQVVRVEYEQSNPELVRVAGRGVTLTLLPVGTTLLAVWLVLIPLVVWLRRRVRRM
ncbi:MAG TPA: DUF3592 domain-containing protein [Actinophytocola sp.]|uniref:DUF3592 domain-containing protein n=1 Tax=Actinophytocola sp. TaxID=1872138 RepID=UPI002DBCCDDE|nr:DUF3592 domain-containing protein [Actinophytocola sp.]HEU5471995.1 DUF3592 domain-containing protein [Actinophytocola sp.]